LTVWGMGFRVNELPGFSLLGCEAAGGNRARSLAEALDASRPLKPLYL